MDDPRLLNPPEGFLDFMSRRILGAPQGLWDHLTGKTPDPTMMGMLALPEATSQLAPKASVLLHSVVGGPEAKSGVSHVVLSSPTALDADTFKDAFLNNLPEGLNAQVTKLKSSLLNAVNPNRHSFRIDWFKNQGGAASAPADFYSRFGLDEALPFIAPAEGPKVLK